MDDVDLERDQTLVRRFQAGDDAAFDELYRRYHDRLERFCRKRVGDQHTAEEVAQEAFTRALTALPDLGGELRFYPWVSVIASRLCVDSHRRQSRSEPACDIDLGAVTGGQDEIVDAVDAALVVTAMARLAPRHQDVLHRREIDGWSYQRIADHYGVTVGTVETLLFRARRALRREFHLVDRAGLTALPVLGRVILLAGRARNRIPTWLPSNPLPSTLAVAATATAAAVALAVVPARAPVPTPAAHPTHQVPVGTHPARIGGGGAAFPALATTTIVAPANPGLAFSASPALVVPPAAATMAAQTTAGTTAPAMSTPSAGGRPPTSPGVIGTLDLPPVTVTTPSTLPSLAGVGPVPPVSVAGLPALPAPAPDLSAGTATVGGVADAAQGALHQGFGGLLSGAR